MIEAIAITSLLIALALSFTGMAIYNAACYVWQLARRDCAP